jgi:hypothetical protein
MVKITDFFPSQYLRCSDLGGKERSVTIDRVEAEIFENDGKKQQKPVIHFKENGVKPLVSNKTNMTRISKIHGDETDDWPGKRVVLAPELVDFKGKATEAVRIKRPAEPAPEINDEIPWK